MGWERKQHWPRKVDIRGLNKQEMLRNAHAGQPGLFGACTAQLRVTNPDSGEFHRLWKETVRPSNQQEMVWLPDGYYHHQPSPEQ